MTGGWIFMTRFGFVKSANGLLLTGILFVLMFTIITPMNVVKAQSNLNAPASMSGTLYVDTEIEMLFGDKGGGSIIVTIEGDMTSELRRRIDSVYYLTVPSPNRDNSKVDGSLKIPTSEVSAFVELIEKRLEVNLITTNQYDLLNSRKNDYNGIFAGVDISREGGSKGVDIVEVEGLSDFSIKSNEDIVLHINFGGIFPDEPETPIYSNGEIIFYSIFGYFPATWSSVNETNPNVQCRESISATVVGMGAYVIKNRDAGEYSRFRFISDKIEFTQNYKLTTTESTGYAVFESGNFLENYIIIAIYGIIVSIVMLSLPGSFFKSSGKEKKIKWIHAMAMGFFVVILLFFFLGINALSIWIGAPIFTVATGIIASRFYSKSAGLDVNSSKQITKTATGGNIKTQWHRMGLKAFERGELDTALDYIERALKESIEDEIIWNDKGHILRKLGRHSEALKCFNVALKINPDYDIALQNKRQTLTDLKRSR
jgi:hypothetical protein